MSEVKSLAGRRNVSVTGGLTAGFVATVVLSLLMMGKSALGLMPALNPIGDLNHVASSFVGMELPSPFGWVAHFLIGTVVWGIAYALLEPYLPGPAVIKGVVFGIFAWLAMMIVFMPVAGHGLFGAALGLPAVVATLGLHLVYGAVLGVTYPNVSGPPARSEVWPG
nr:DUF6789 family protein [uncultured Rhodopila sp.]